MAKRIELTAEDIALLEGLEPELLLAIIKCKRLKDLQKLLDEKCPANKDKLLSIAKNRAAYVKSASNKVLEALLDLLTPMSYIFLVSDTAFTLLTAIAVTAFIAAATVFLGLVAAVGVIYFTGVYKELKAKDEKKDKEYQLLAFQNDCADAYIKKQKLTHDLKNVEDTEKDQKKVDKRIWQRTKDSLGTGILVGGTIFYTYYAISLALTVALAGSAAVAAMTGPIGIGVALAIALGVGIYFGYKKYQQCKRNQILEKERKKLQNEFDDKCQICVEPTNALENSKKSRHDKTAKLVLGPMAVGQSTRSKFSSSEYERRNNPNRLYQPKEMQQQKKPMQQDSLESSKDSSEPTSNNDEKDNTSSAPITRSRSNSSRS